VRQHILGMVYNVTHCFVGNLANFLSRPPSRSRKPLRLAEDILRLASRLAAAYG